MIVKVNKSECLHNLILSYYNNNYYWLPFEINGCSVLYDYCNEEYESSIKSIGIVEDGRFIPKFYLNNDEKSEWDYFLLDQETLSIDNKFI